MTKRLLSILWLLTTVLSYSGYTYLYNRSLELIEIGFEGGFSEGFAAGYNKASTEYHERHV
jgi:hypothetical protein